MPVRDSFTSDGTPVSTFYSLTADETLTLPGGFASGRTLVVKNSSESTRKAIVTPASGQTLDGVLNGKRVVPANAEVKFTRGDGGTWDSSGGASLDVLAAGNLYRKRLSNMDIRPNAAGQGSGTATLGTFATSSLISSPRAFKAITVSGSSSQFDQSSWALTGGSNWSARGSSFPQNNAMWPKWINNGTVNGPYCIDLMHYGTAIDLNVDTLTGYYWRVSVDGTIIGAVSTNGTNSIIPVTFGDARPRRIRFESSGGPFYGLNIEPSGATWKPPLRGPRIIVAGDSYTAGTGATYGAASNWVRAFANTLERDDAWTCGIGGTGWMNPGSSVKMFDHIADVTGNLVDGAIVVWAHGHNDTAYTKAQVAEQVGLCMDAVSTAATTQGITVTQIAVSPLWTPGPPSFSAGLYNVRDAIHETAVARDIPFVDVMEMPLDAAPIVTTQAANSSVSATTVQAVALLPWGSTIELGTYPAVERREVTNISGTGPFTHTVAALSSAHTAGEPIRQVGRSWVQGSGRVGTTTGFGSSDVFTATDGVHPSQDGHDALGVCIATQLARYVLPA